jgi:4-hydroxyphenylacetate 3-monooxygenase
MALKEHEPTIEYLVDVIVEVQTVRSCIAAAERDPEFTPMGYCFPNHCHLAAGGIALFKARQRISEVLRILPGSSLVVAPADTDLAAPELAAGLEESFAGRGWTAQQRSALLQLAWDHVSSALDGRESAFELHASGGMPNWRGWLRQNFRDYNALANAVLRSLAIDMPEIDVSNIPQAPITRRRFRYWRAADRPQAIKARSHPLSRSGRQ